MKFKKYPLKYTSRYNFIYMHKNMYIYIEVSMAREDY